MVAAGSLRCPYNAVRFYLVATIISMYHTGSLMEGVLVSPPLPIAER